ncbi:Adaptin N terminal region family protein [Histomonas meleagridis]|nr:Adaptin N terminal region family protein [Histomonas meleagridis]
MKFFTSVVMPLTSSATHRTITVSNGPEALISISDRDFPADRSFTTAYTFAFPRSNVTSHKSVHRYRSLGITVSARRALDDRLALVDNDSRGTRHPEIIEDRTTADSDFRTEDGVSKIYSSVIRFGPNPTWDFDIIHLLFINNDDYITNDLLTSFCVMVAKNKSCY